MRIEQKKSVTTVVAHCLYALTFLGMGSAIAAGEAEEGAAAGDKLVIIGASYANSWKIDELGGMKVINKGGGGEQSFEMLQRFEQDVVAEKPRAVLIWGFINNVFRNPKENIDQTMQGFKQDFEKMVDIARAHNIKPILATEVTVRPNKGLLESAVAWVNQFRNKPSYQDYVNAKVREGNVWIRQYGKAEGIPVLDFEMVLADGKGYRKKEYAKRDGSHISEQGYEALTRYAVSLMPTIEVGGSPAE